MATKPKPKATRGKGKPGTVKAQPILSKVTPAEAMLHFRSATGEWNKSSIGLVVSGALCLITGLYSKDKTDYETTILKMKAEVAQRNIKIAQSYKYIGLSRYLVNHLASKFPVAGPILDVTRAETWEGAAAVLTKYLEKARVRTLDDLGVMLGRYKRSRSPAGAGNAPSLVPAQDGGNVVSMATRAAPGAIVQRIKAQPDVLAGLKPADFASAVMRSGRDPLEMMEAFIPYLTSARACSKLIKRIEQQAELVKKGQLSTLGLLAQRTG